MESLNENLITNMDDIYYNKDKFDSGEINLCFITGHSGSGKTSMAKDMKHKRIIEHVELDNIQFAKDHYSMEDIKKMSSMMYAFFSSTGKKYYKTLHEVDKEGIGPEFNENLFKDFIKFAKRYAKSHPEKKFVVEGIWIFCRNGFNGHAWFSPHEFNNCAFYIKGTSKLISKVRAVRRELLHPTTQRDFKWIEIGVRNFFLASIDEGIVNEYRNYFAKRSLKEEGMVGMIGASLPLTPNPIPYESNKDNYYIIQHPMNNVFAYSITKDPIQYQMYAIDPERGYKVTQTDKGKFNKEYLTFKVKDHNTAKAAYEEIKNLFENNIPAPSADYIYTLCTGHELIESDQLLYDDKLELVGNWYEEIQENCEKLEDYLLNGTPLKEESYITTQDGDRLVHTTIEPKSDLDEYMTEWMNKLDKVRNAEAEGLVIVIDSDSDRKMDQYTQENIDKVNAKWDKFNALSLEQRELSDLTANNILGIDNYNLYCMILSKFGELKDYNASNYSVDTTGSSNINLEPYYSPNELAAKDKSEIDTEIKVVNGINVDNFRNNYIKTGKLGIRTEAWSQALKELTTKLEFAHSESRIHDLKGAITSLGWNPGIGYTNEAASKTWSRHTFDDIFSVDLTRFYLNESLRGSEMELTEAYTSDFLKNKIIPVFVVLTDLNMALQKAIKMATGSQWAHAAFSFKSDLSTTYSFSKHGFSHESISLYLNKNPNAKLKVYALFITPEQKKSIQKAINWYSEHKADTSYAYNNAASIAIHAKKGSNDDLRMVCSQFVYNLLKLANFTLNGNKDASVTSPGDIEKLSNDPRMFIMYSGYMDKYNPKVVNKMCYDMLPTLPMNMYGIQEDSRTPVAGDKTLKEFIYEYRNNPIIQYLKPLPIM